MSKPATVHITQNFENNLDGIQQFLIDIEIPEQFDILIDNVFGTIIPNLERFPNIGVNFLDRLPVSVEAMGLIDSIHRYLKGKGDIREYISGDYLVLYALIGNDLFLLCIKHHKQLAFDFAGIWIDY